MKFFPSNYLPAFRQRVCNYYRTHLPFCSLRSVSQRYGLSQGGNTLKNWLSKWNYKCNSLRDRPKKGRPPILSMKLVKKYVGKPIKKKNLAAEPAHYNSMLHEVRRKTKKKISRRTLNRYGLEKLGIKEKTVIKRTLHECKFINTNQVSQLSFFFLIISLFVAFFRFEMSLVSKELCEAIAKVRRKMRQIPNAKIVVMDETYYTLSEAPKRTLVYPGHKALVQVFDNSRYAGRYDMISFISGEKVHPPIIFSPEERKERRVKGITSDMLNSYIEDYLARSIAALDKYPLYLLCDKSSIHNPSKMKESFENGLCFEIVDISFLPTKSAKRLSPLDNGLYHSWKEGCRNHFPLTPKNIKQIMSDEWENIEQEKITAAYRHCGLTRARDPYFDCPLPALHRH